MNFKSSERNAYGTNQFSNIGRMSSKSSIQYVEMIPVPGDRRMQHMKMTLPNGDLVKAHTSLL